MDELDKKIKKVWGKGKKRGPVVRSDNCPGDEILSLYIDGALKDQDKEKIEQHVLECDYCLDGVLFHKITRDDQAYAQFPDAPALWKEKVENLFAGQAVKGKPGFFDVVLRFTKEAIEVISNPGNIAIAYGPMPEPVRSDNKALSANHIILSKIFSDMESEVEVERVDDLHVNMKIRAVNIHSKAPAKVLRISLFNPLRELASYITDNGEVHFGNLNYGEYEIKIIRDRKEIGKISLSITLNIN